MPKIILTKRNCNKEEQKKKKKKKKSQEILQLFSVLSTTRAPLKRRVGEREMFL